MNRIKLVKPRMEHEQLVLEYKQEFIDHQDSMDGTAGLRNANSFEEWFHDLNLNNHEDTVKEGLVPSTTFLVLSINDESLIGMIDIRHRLNEYLYMYGGHIGYSVRKQQRRKGYATEMLGLALKECLRLKINPVLLTCDQDNTASARTIIKNGGQLYNTVKEDDQFIQRYWIYIE